MKLGFEAVRAELNTFLAQLLLQKDSYSCFDFQESFKISNFNWKVTEIRFGTD